jgi:hypothetical protein
MSIFASSFFFLVSPVIPGLMTDPPSFHPRIKTIAPGRIR